MSEQLDTVIQSPFNILHTLLGTTRENTQSRCLLNIFHRAGFDVRIPKRQLEKELGFFHAFKDVIISEANPITITSLQQLTDLAGLLPGDLQRTLRTFHDKHHRYGLERDGAGENISYWWTSITQTEYDWTRGIPIVPRNIFPNDAERDAFVESRGSCCEICGSKERLAVDHWRAHSVYQIDSPLIAVLLCEQCNNTHHNYDASKLMVKKKENLQCVKNWIEIEKKIRLNGYLPNEMDQQSQNANIDIVFDYYKTAHEVELVTLLELRTV